MYTGIGHSPYIEHANKEILWLPMDTEALYNQHINNSEKLDLLIKYQWLNKKFTYKFNSNGFRCQDFSNNPSVAFFGCSLTVGIGLPLENVWTTLVAEKLNLIQYNFGIGGTSNDTAFRLALAWLPKISPKIVVFGQTYAHRFEIFSIKKLGSSQEYDQGEFDSNWQSNNMYHEINKTKNALAMENLCRQLNIKFITLDCTEIPYLDYARDLFHPGVESNKLFSNTVIEKIN
jgi:hypothetical protein